MSEIGDIPSGEPKKDGVDCSSSFADRTGVEHGTFEIPNKSKVAEGRFNQRDGSEDVECLQLNSGAPGVPGVSLARVTGEGMGILVLRMVDVRKASG